MIVEVKIPSPGESITEVEIASWLVNDGDFVEKDQEIAEIESDKATLPLLAEKSGTLKIIAETGKAIEVGSVACTIDTSGKGPERKPEETSPGEEKSGESLQEEDSALHSEHVQQDNRKGKKQDQSPASEIKGKKDKSSSMPTGTPDKVKVSPLAKKLMEEKGLSVDDIINGLVRITREDVALVAETQERKIPGISGEVGKSRKTGRQKMSMLRRKLSQRLVAVKNETAMLTTFNEVDMSNIINIRKTYQERFIDKHGVKLGFMSFFVKAVTEALKTFPHVNSYIDGDEIVTHDYCDIGIAVQTGKGLMVPVMRNTEAQSLAHIEKTIMELAEKARKNRISIEDMSGGTFTITNGGVFGSLLSTPVLNPPQSGILGMHNIVERPVAVKGRVEIRPMMYLALSYDHRIIDGRDSVGFLVKVKEMLEDPVKMLFGGASPRDLLLGL
ncbi:MAG: 2-oxoglutarate dehydrogenase complex dihydrolipoyllysine-residue succinyltransferase [Bacteroidales bacterium]